MKKYQEVKRPWWHMAVSLMYCHNLELWWTPWGKSAVIESEYSEHWQHSCCALIPGFNLIYPIISSSLIQSNPICLFLYHIYLYTWIWWDFECQRRLSQMELGQTSSPRSNKVLTRCSNIEVYPCLSTCMRCRLGSMRLGLCRFVLIANTWLTSAKESKARANTML